MNDDNKLIQNLQNTVKESQSELDARTLGQLRAARRTALESLTDTSDSWWYFTGRKILLSSAVVIILTVSVFYPMYFNKTEHYILDEIALSEDLELLEELDFYFWIADTIENES